MFFALFVTILGFSTYSHYYEANKKLPISTFVVGDAPFQNIVNLEVPQTDDQKNIGLRNRKTIGQSQGMAFPWHSSANNFQLSRVNFPVDLIFIDQYGKVITIVPKATEKQKIAYPNKPVSMIMALRAGTARLNGFQKNTKVHLEEKPSSAK